MAASKNTGNTNNYKDEGTVSLVLAPCHTSHEFTQRKIPVPKIEENAIKIGRAVGRISAGTNNAIFDCKVLSRNHAIVWGENDKFYIKDTKSSNGTFVNSNRLSNSGEESEPTQLATGDILQLGVEIVDSTKKVASGCIIAMVTFVDELGNKILRKQAVKNKKQINNVINDRITKHSFVIPEDQMFQLQLYINEAKHRESALNQKLLLLEDLLKTAKNASEMNWEAMVNEDHLLDRIRSLESKLKLCLNKNLTSEELKNEICVYFEERNNVEAMTKDLLKKSHQETSEVRQRLQEAELALFNVEDNNGFLKKQLNDAQKEISELKYELEKLSSDYDVVCQELEFTKATNQHLMLTAKNQEAKPSVSNILENEDDVDKVVSVPEIPNSIVIENVEEKSDISLSDFSADKLQQPHSDILSSNGISDEIDIDKEFALPDEDYNDEITETENTNPEIVKENINKETELNSKDITINDISGNVTERIVTLEEREKLNDNSDINNSNFSKTNNIETNAGNSDQLIHTHPCCSHMTGLNVVSKRNQEEDLVGMMPLFALIYLIYSLSSWTKSLICKDSKEKTG